MQQVFLEELKGAYGAIPQNKRHLLFTSDPVDEKGFTVSQFAIALTTRIGNSLGSGLTMKAAFKGGAGRGVKDTGRSKELTSFAQDQAKGAGLTFVSGESLLDFMVYGSSILDVKLTVESEARPISRAENATYDFEKLMLVASPLRVFVGRVNVTKLGKRHKLETAVEQLKSLFGSAVLHRIVRENDKVIVLLLETSRELTPKVHLALASGRDKALAFMEYLLVSPSNSH